MLGVFALFLCMESNTQEKSTKNSVVSNFFARTPSMNRWVARISEVVDQFFS